VSIFDYIQQGGTIMYILLLLNVVGFAVMISKFLIFNKETKNISSTVSSLEEKVSHHKNNKSQESVVELAKQELNYEVSTMEKGLNTVKIIATISPLLGLLGTVLGVLIAFRVMSQTGLNNPASFAKGISMALITTVGGMIVAIPHYIGYNYLIGMVDRIEVKLEKELLGKLL
jgi:biopolymer transport protein ExbB